MSEFFAYKIIYGIKCALASCRRVLLLLLLFIVILLAWVWWTLPNLDQIRPEIEAGLRAQWSLKTLTVGRLSWRWRGDLEIHADRLSFVSPDGQIQLQDAQISLIVSISQVVMGIWLPEQIYIRNGLLHIRSVNKKPNKQTNSASTLFNAQRPLLVAFENMTLVWQYHQQSRTLHHAKGFFSTTQRSIELFADELNLQLMLDDDNQPQLIKADIDKLRWLLRSDFIQLSPHTSAKALLRRKDEKTWQLSLSLLADSGSFTVASAPFHLPFHQLSLESEIITPAIMDPSRWQRIHFSKFYWKHGDDRIQATATWKLGILSLKAESPHLSMPLLWSWLRPIDDSPEWHHWLSTMRHGVARNSRVAITLSWLEPWHALPASLDKNAFRYRVQSKISNMDINLGVPDESLLHTEASIDLDENGLDATIFQTTLPHAIGLAEGQLHIPWDTLMLHIKAQTNDVDIMRLHRWVDPDGAKQVGWKYGRAKGSVSLLWDPVKPAPQSATAVLSPVSPWQLYLENRNITVNGGTVIWKKNNGVQAKALSIQSDLLSATVNFDGELEGSSWHFNQFSGDFSMPLARLVSSYHIPIGKPSGMFKAHLEFDRNWHGRIILHEAAWDNFLGESKRIGQPMSLQFTAHDLAKDGIKVDEFVCRDAGFELHGSGYINTKGIAITLDKVKTSGFRGSLSIIAPRGNKPWEMTINADYLRRSALPDSLPTNKKEKVDKNWALQARIRQFDWQDARMQNIQLSMRSERHSLGRFIAQKVDVGSMKLHDVAVRFRLLGKGKIEVERLNAMINEQNLQLTATLKPLPDGSMRWQGFANTRGDFSRMMSRSGFTTMFAGGKGQLLFAGEGLLMRKQAWWQGLRGRLRLRVDGGSLNKGGLLTKLLAITSIADLPALLIGQRKDLTHKGLFYKRLQIEATLNDQNLHIHQLAMRSTAMDMAGYGHYNLEKRTIDLTTVFRPLQNLDAILDKIPLLRDLIGGSAHSFIRKVYHMHGPIGDATIDQVSPTSAGLASPGIIEGLLTLPDRWFGGMKTKQNSKTGTP